MAMPQWHELMRPVLEALNEHEMQTVAELEAYVAQVFNMTDEELAERLEKSGQRRIRNRLGWATTDLEKAKYLSYGKKKGTYLATNEGRTFLLKHPGAITANDLMESSTEFRAWREGAKTAKNADASTTTEEPTATPQETMEAAHSELRTALCDELLQKVHAQDPYEFEHTVASLLKAMGYGDSWGKSVQVTKKSGDGGIDGFVREDRLGFDMVYYQAKRWDIDSTVGSPQINAFVGALLGKGASKGVFITTGKFSKAAKEYAEGLKQQRVVLIDGRQLAELMVDHNVGVSTIEVFEIKAIDSDFFGGE